MITYAAVWKSLKINPTDIAVQSAIADNAITSNLECHLFVSLHDFIMRRLLPNLNFFELFEKYHFFSFLKLWEIIEFY